MQVQARPVPADPGEAREEEAEEGVYATVERAFLSAASCGGETSACEGGGSGGGGETAAPNVGRAAVKAAAACCAAGLGSPSGGEDHPSHSHPSHSPDGAPFDPLGSLREGLWSALQPACATDHRNRRARAHRRAFPPLANVVEEGGGVAVRFRRGTAAQVLAGHFEDGAARSLADFHTDRGDDQARFGPWTGLQHAPPASASTLPPLVGGLPPIGDRGGSSSPPHSRKRLGAAVTAGRQGTASPSGTGGTATLSLMGGDIPMSLLSSPPSERRGSFRTPVRVPGAGLSMTEVSMVQRLFHMDSGDDLGLAGPDSDEDRTYVIESVLRLLDVPYSDRFRVVIRKTLRTEPPRAAGTSTLADRSNALADDLVSLSPPPSPGRPAEAFSSSSPPPSPVPSSASGASSAAAASASSVRLCAAGSSPHSGLKTRKELREQRLLSDAARTPTALVRVEFEVQFQRRCKFEDRIRRMLTKKITKLLQSWCVWALDGWNRERVAGADGGGGRETPLHGRASPLPGRGLGLGACMDLGSPELGCFEGPAPCGGAGSRRGPRRWQSLPKGAKGNESFLLWSMTDLDDDDDDEWPWPGTGPALQRELSSGSMGENRLEWHGGRRRNLREKEEASRFVIVPNPSRDDSYAGASQSSDRHRGMGIELCLSDDGDDAVPGRRPLNPISPVRAAPSELPISQLSLSPCGFEVVYMSDGGSVSSSGESSPPSPASDGEGGGGVAAASRSLFNAPPLPASRHGGGFGRRRASRKAEAERKQAQTS